ncbi:MucR family transcriptional regulator [Sinorhizobium sp. BJ1]|uniref:MucR family transcriptional regulator n=1 Tax=Sinorhizobium sp. BJ1 TaxID=2035455 RepID=UPI001FE18C87|nr:MucR family transcriptional regulator [Sinorhizobium sp. BJ1]
MSSCVPIKKSVTEDFMICLEDGRKLKSMTAPGASTLSRAATRRCQRISPAERSALSITD